MQDNIKDNSNSLHNILGAFGSMDQCSAAFVSSSQGTKKWPDIYLLTFGFTITPDFGAGIGWLFRFQPGLLEKYFAGDVGSHGFLVGIILGLPKSRGMVQLVSKDPKVRLRIDPKYFSHPDDQTAMLEGTI